MKNLIYSFGIVAILCISACTKHTIIEETITEQGEAPSKVNYFGVWKVKTSDPTETLYYSFKDDSPYYLRVEEDGQGFRDVEYGTVLVTDKMFRISNYSNRPYELVEDTLTLIGGWDGPGAREVMVRITDGSITPENIVKELNVLRTAVPPLGNGNNPSTNASFGIDGDFLYINHRPTGTYKFYKFNTINSTYTDSVNSPASTWHALHYKGSSNKLYNTGYSSNVTMQQRVGLTGVNSNLSSNTLSNIRAISTNATSGTVYSYRSGTLYSGTEGGNFSTLYSFTGNTPQCVVYYKNDQFLGVYNDQLILFEISPSFKIVDQYSLSGGKEVYQSISTNGSDIWVLSYDDATDRYQYLKVALP